MARSNLLSGLLYRKSSWSFVEVYKYSKIGEHKKIVLH